MDWNVFLEITDVFAVNFVKRREKLTVCAAMISLLFLRVNTKISRI